MSSRASSMVANSIRFQKGFHVLCDDIIFEVYRIIGSCRLEVGIFQRVRNYRDRKPAGPQGCDSQADSIYRNGALFHDVARRRFRRVHLKIPTVAEAVKTPDSSHAIDVALNNVAAEPRI